MEESTNYDNFYEDDYDDQKYGVPPLDVLDATEDSFGSFLEHLQPGDESDTNANTQADFSDAIADLAKHVGDFEGANRIHSGVKFKLNKPGKKRGDKVSKKRTVNLASLKHDANAFHVAAMELLEKPDAVDKKALNELAGALKSFNKQVKLFQKERERVESEKYKQDLNEMLDT